MTAPRVNAPRDVAYLREWMIRQWQPDAPFAQTAAYGIGLLAKGRSADSAADQISEWNRSCLRNADLWWVNADMVDLIEASAADLPDVELRPELLAAEEAFVVFERPLQGTDAVHSGQAVLVDAVMWSRSVLPPVDLVSTRSAGRAGVPRPGVSMMLYRRARLEDGLGSGELQQFALLIAAGGCDVPEGADLVVNRDRLSAEDAEQYEPGLVTKPSAQTVVLAGDVWLPLGRTDWVIGDSASAKVSDAVTDEANESMREDRRWLATLCALATQPNIVDLSVEQAARPVQRQAARRGWSDPRVHVVNLRRSIYEGAEAGREPEVDEHGRRVYRVRWPVKGHWRSQPYGPARAYRRPTYIAPYIKGPEGAPLRSGATVHVLKGEQ